MKLARTTHQLLEEFFREYYDDEKIKLPTIILFAKRGARLLTKLLKIHGITFGSRMFIAPELVFRNEQKLLCIDKQLLAHEATHVLQYQRQGFVKFFYTYLKSYWQELRAKKSWDFAARYEAYRAIPQETEARAVAEAFMQWLEKRRIERAEKTPKEYLNHPLRRF